MFCSIKRIFKIRSRIKSLGWAQGKAQPGRRGFSWDSVLPLRAPLGHGPGGGVGGVEKGSVPCPASCPSLHACPCPGHDQAFTAHLYTDPEYHTWRYVFVLCLVCVFCMSYIRLMHVLQTPYICRMWDSGRFLALLFRSWEGSCHTQPSPPVLPGRHIVGTNRSSPHLHFSFFPTQARSVSGAGNIPSLHPSPLGVTSRSPPRDVTPRFPDVTPCIFYCWKKGSEAEATGQPPTCPCGDTP